MPTFRKGHSAIRAITANDTLIKRISGYATVAEPGIYATAADSLTLRGIPAIGPGVTGAIPGTAPHSIR